MYGVIAEDDSDCEVLEVLIRRLSRLRVSIMSKGYGGCGELLTKGAKQLRAYVDLGYRRLVICYDADGGDPEPRRLQIFERIVIPSKLPQEVCLALVPVQEIEAWILADLDNAIPPVIPSWRPPAIDNPETISSPKEELKRLSRASNKKPRYVYTIHNARVASHLRFDVLYKKCPSFRPLSSFVLRQRPRKVAEEPFPGPERHLWLCTLSDTEHRFQTRLASQGEWGVAVQAIRQMASVPLAIQELIDFGCADREAIPNEWDSLFSSCSGTTLQLMRTLQAAITAAELQFVSLDDGTR